MISFILNVKKRQIHRDRKQISGCLQMGWRLIANGHERIFRSDRNVTNWIVSTSGYISKRIQSRSLKRYLHAHFHSCTIHNNQEEEATQVSTDGWMNKENVVYTYNGILFSVKKEENSDSSWGHYDKWNKPVTKRQILYDSTKVSQVDDFTETESRMIVARTGGARMGNFYLTGTEFQFCKIKSCRDWLHNNVNALNTNITELYT